MEQGIYIYIYIYIYIELLHNLFRHILMGNWKWHGKMLPNSSNIVVSVPLFYEHLWSDHRIRGASLLMGIKSSKFLANKQVEGFKFRDMVFLSFSFFLLLLLVKK